MSNKHFHDQSYRGRCLPFFYTSKMHYYECRAASSCVKKIDKIYLFYE